jgi:hypothetical protein
MSILICIEAAEPKSGVPLDGASRRARVRAKRLRAMIARAASVPAGFNVLHSSSITLGNSWLDTGNSDAFAKTPSSGPRAIASPENPDEDLALRMRARHRDKLLRSVESRGFMLQRSEIAEVAAGPTTKVEDGIGRLAV